MDRPGPRIAALLLAALALRVAFVLATPSYQLVHDALDYDRHAQSIAQGHGFALAYGRPTAFRPPAYPIFLAGVYELTGTADAPVADRIRAARLANTLVGTALVALIGLLAAQLWGRREALAALALAAAYVPLILVGQSVMSEPLFALFMLASLSAALQLRRSPHRYRYAALAGALAGVAILGRANAIVLLAPLAFAAWRGRSLGPAVALVVAAALTVAPWTIRNAVVLHAFVPVSTQLGSALAGTYNSEARADRENPASWRALKRVDDYRGLFKQVRATPEPVLERQLRRASLRFARDHPGYVLTVGYWTTLRMLELAGLDWSIHTAATVGAGRGWAVAGVVCFWLFALAAVAGACTRRARAAPLWVWAFPALMHLSVVLLVVETPRYRTAIDPFIVLLAALALTRWRRPTPGPRER
jgi:4-amino-4-deoxy-L-arabinose transferase-like glycosyltransferase